jgi:hypothetical protein
VRLAAAVTLAATLVSLAAARPVQAQIVRADPGVVINGRVATAIYTTMRTPGSYGQPVPRVPLLIVDSLGQRNALATDDAGTLTVMLEPGRYRVVTTIPVEYQGIMYSWDVRMVVRRGIPIFDLTQANATTAVAAPGASAAVRRSQVRVVP